MQRGEPAQVPTLRVLLLLMADAVSTRKCLEHLPARLVRGSQVQDTLVILTSPVCRRGLSRVHLSRLPQSGSSCTGLSLRLERGRAGFAAKPKVDGAKPTTR